jgi:hypothetical protein
LKSVKFSILACIREPFFDNIHAGAESLTAEVAPSSRLQ